MKALKYMLFVLFLQAGAYYLNAQTTTIIANLHDTLKPKTTYLIEASAPETKQAGQPKVTTFAPNIAHGQAFFTTYNSDDGLAMDAISFGHKSSICDNEGNIWFATQGGGVSKYDGNSFVSYTTEQGLASNNVLSIAEDNSGNLWFGTYGGGVSLLSAAVGVEKLQGKKDKIKFLCINNVNGLPDNGICALRFDDQERLIIGSNFGIFILPKTELVRITAANSFNDIGQLQGVIYNQFTGYPIRDVNTGQNNGAMHVDSKGILWVGHGSNGVTRVDLDTVNKSSAAPHVVINKVSLKGEAICYYSLDNTDSTTVPQQEVATYGKVLSQAERDTLQQRYKGISFNGITRFYPLPENLVLPYEHNALTFEFNAIETGRNFMVNYQFALSEGSTPKLGGVSAGRGGQIDWLPITKKHEATYNNLSEGNYTFLLKAKNPWGVWSEPIEYSFRVLPPWYRTWWAYSICVLLVLFLIWGLIQMQTKRLQQRQVELEQEVEEATSEIKQQKEEIEEVHKEITDSIDYAERIQFSFLATKEMLNENLGEHFVFFRPKDVVSGDFYWANKLSNGNFAVVNADSTGHGVPGAIMSILNISSIESAIEQGLTNPAEIFNESRKRIIERLKKDGSVEGGMDGMDASIVCFNADKTKMTYTAAQNPIWIIRNNELIQIKAEKMPVGKHDNDHIPFEGGEFDLQKGDQVYTLTDGFQDQFGGQKGKKFMIKKMREYVLSISHLPMQEQYQKLDEVFSNWKGKLEQIDDVCVIGIRI